VLGGAQAATVIGWDEPYDIPTEGAQQIALATQQIIAAETHIPATVDPLAGSYYVEQLTDETEQRLRSFMAEIDDEGGVLATIESGWLQSRFYDNAYEYEKSVANGELPIVGVNVFADDDNPDDGLFSAGDMLHEADEGVADRQGARLDQHRRSRDSMAVVHGLDAVREAAEGRENVVPPIKRAVVAGATLGEVTAALKDVFGGYQEGGRI
jgi:methylmalonyl-CoA mutase N-terminal domain/subunit